jgi:Flp pilus assembly protein TadB
LLLTRLVVGIALLTFGAWFIVLLLPGNPSSEVFGFSRGWMIFMAGAIVLMVAGVLVAWTGVRKLVRR